MTKRGNYSFFSKVSRDYKSNIECLPGYMKNEANDQKTRRVPKQKFISNDIFAKENPNNNHSAVLLNSRKSNNTSRNMFGTTNQEMNLFEGRKVKKPEYKNMFQSQLNI